jgi:UPF0042 nucleotide-binding protein
VPKIPVVIVSGLSGSGKTTAMKALEDIGWFCIDNLPVSLLPRLLDLCDSNDDVERVAVAMDVREGRFLADVEATIFAIEAEGHPVSILFLDSREDVLIRRFSETRRRHPLYAGNTVAEGIEQERRVLAGIRERATVQLDTSSTNVHQLRRLVQDRFGQAAATRRMCVNIVSFGYKYGVPPEADYVFDVRFLPNPYFIEQMRMQTGKDPEVVRFLDEQPEGAAFLGRLDNLLDFALPLHDNEGRSLVTLAVGCTGGRHRSVYIAGELSRRLGERYEVNLLHRDIGRL